MSNALFDLGLIFIFFSAVYIVGCLVASALGFRSTRPMATRNRTGRHYQGDKNT